MRPAPSSPPARTAPRGESSPRRGRRRWARRALLVAAALTAATTAAAVLALHVLGPRVGVYVLPPSPERYARVALDALDGGYHTDDPRWPAVRAEVLRVARTADDRAQLHGPLQAAVRVAGGAHSSLVLPQRGPGGAGSPAAAPAVTTAGGVTTVVLPEATDPSPQAQQRYARTVADAVERAAGSTCGWVVDLRGNTGGTMDPMLSAVTALLPDGPALSFRPRRGAATPVTVQPDGAGLAGRTGVGVGERAKVRGPVAVLQDERTASSGEAVLTAFRGLERVRSFGAASAGYTSANSTHRLYDGAELVLTESVYVDRDGVVLDEVPVVADQPGTSASAPGDAAQWLRGQGCG